MVSLYLFLPFPRTSFSSPVFDLQYQYPMLPERSRIYLFPSSSQFLRERVPLSSVSCKSHSVVFVLSKFPSHGWQYLTLARNIHQKVDVPLLKSEGGSSGDMIHHHRVGVNQLMQLA